MAGPSHQEAASTKGVVALQVLQEGPSYQPGRRRGWCDDDPGYPRPHECSQEHGGPAKHGCNGRACVHAITGVPDPGKNFWEFIKNASAQLPHRYYLYL